MHEVCFIASHRHQPYLGVTEFLLSLLLGIVLEFIAGMFVASSAVSFRELPGVVEERRWLYSTVVV